MMDYLKKLPKVELHVHLDGSVRPTTASELLGQPLSDVKEAMMAPSTCHSLTEYLKRFDLPISLLQTKENIIRIARELALDLKDDGVIYAEIRFCPLFHAQQGLSKEEVVEAVLEGLSTVDLKTNLILCMMRHFSFEQNLEVISLAEKYLYRGVCALDLAGDEANFPTGQFAPLFEVIREKQIPYTIHAGEAAGMESVKSALAFKTNRLGHGIHIIDDLNFAKQYANKNIMLEICPTSNVQTKAVSSYQNHPIKTLFSLGYPVSINTDNRTVSNITLTKEYELLQKHFGFTEKEFQTINLQAIEYSFLKQEEKDEIIKTIKKM